MKLTHKFFALAVETGSVEQIEVQMSERGLAVTAEIRGRERAELFTNRGAVRVFKSWSTCMRYLRSIGVTRVAVDMANWEPHAQAYKEHGV